MIRNIYRTVFVVLLLGVPEAVHSQIIKIEADGQKGFQWPYYAYVPPQIKTPTVLLVESNNTGTISDNQSVHDAAAFNQIRGHMSWADSLGSPYLVPTFPRPASNWKVYTQALDRDTLTTTLPGLVRIDLQLIAMIDDARSRLAASGIAVGSKVWIIGYSASGSFANRFALLHPDRVLAMSAGSGGEYAIAPVPVWKGKTLRYPVGVADLEQLTGKPFDLSAFSKVPVQIYIGDLQVDDAVNYSDGYDAEDASLIKSVFGGPTFRRYPASEAAYHSVGSPCQFVIWPGVAHQWPDWNFIREFLEHNRAEPLPPPLPKPLLYKLYFPHVASSGQWGTEIALTNTSEVAVRGELQAFNAEGGLPVQSVAMTVPPLGRKQIDVGTHFVNPGSIAYLAYVSDSGFLSGYTRFSQPANRATLAAGIGTKLGWFTKVEQDGWTGIAFVNTDAAVATVNLTAYAADGGQVATRTITLNPGQKSVGMVDQLFSASLITAKYVKLKSDKNVLAFTVSGSSDGQMLDGLHCLDQYSYSK